MDQLLGNPVNKCLCFPHKDSTIPLLSKLKLSSHLTSNVAVQLGLVGPGQNASSQVFS